MENAQVQGFCWEDLQLLNASRLFLGMDMKCDLGKLSLESPHGRSKC